MKNILLVGEYHSTNLGDNVLCHCTKSILAKYIPNDCSFFWLDLTYGDRLTNSKKIVYIILHFCSFLFPSSFIQKVRSFYITKCVMLEFSKMKKKMSIDLIIFAGGQIFMDYFAPQVYHIVMNAKKDNIPVVFNACGSGRNTKESKRLFTKALSQNNVKKITVRDGVFMMKSLTSMQVKQIPDWAILASDVYHVVKSNSDTIGLGVIDPIVYNLNNNVYVSEDDFFVFWKRVIFLLDEKQQKWQLFVNGSTGDYCFANRLIEYLGLKDFNKILAPCPKSGKELVSLISSYKSIISFRLHSHIISYSLGIPTVGIVWDDKLIEFARLIHSEDRFSRIEDFDYSKLISMLEINSKELYSSEFRTLYTNTIKRTIMSYTFLLTKKQNEKNEKDNACFWDSP